jgi:hypothetical protein
MNRVKKIITLNGARGAAMFFKGLLAIVFGLAFSSPWKVIPPPPSGLVLLNDFIPLEVWGIGWFIAGFALLIGAFRTNQSKPMGMYAFMLFIWFASYVTTIVTELIDQGYSDLWFAAAVYGSLLGSAISVARLLNAPPANLNLVTQELEALPKEESGDDA